MTDLGTKTFSWNLVGAHAKTEHVALPDGSAVDLTLTPSYDRRHNVFNVALDAAYTAASAPAPTPTPTPVPTPTPTPVPTPTPTPTPTPSPTATTPVSGAKVGALLKEWDFVADPSSFAGWAKSWFGGSSQNNIVTSAANAVLTPQGVQLWKRNGAGASINTTPHDSGSDKFTFKTGYIEWLATFSSLEGSQPTSNYHDSAGANNSNAIPGNWIGGEHAFACERQAAQNLEYYDETLARQYATNDGDAVHYLVANVGANGWSALWDNTEIWPTGGEDDTAEDYGPGGNAPDGVYVTIHRARVWALA